MRGSFARFYPFERRWLVEVFQTLIPSGADERAALGAADAPMDRFVDDLLNRAPMQFVMGLRGCLWLLMLSPVLLLLRFTTFLGLGDSERLAVLERFRQSDVYVIRELPLLLKTIGCLGFCGLPEVQAQLGIAPRDTEPATWAKRRLPQLYKEEPEES